MPYASVLAGSVSQSFNFFLQDSSSTIGAGLAGLVFNSSGLGANYAFPRGGSTSIALVTLGSATAAWSSGGFVQIDSVGMKGWYRLDVPNAMLAAGNGRFVSLDIHGAANLAQAPVVIELTGWDNQDSVRGGLQALPNAAAAASGGLIINGTNAGSGSASMTWNGDIGGRVLGNTTTAFGGVGAQVDVEQWGAHTFTTNVNGVPIIDVKYSEGVQVFNSDGTLAGAGASTIQFNTTDSGGNAIPDDNRFEWSVLQLVSGTGEGQFLLTTTKAGGTRTFNYVGAYTPVTPDNTTQYVVLDTWRANSTYFGGTFQTSRDIGASVLVSVGTGAGQINASGGKVPATLNATDVTGNVACDLQTVKTQTVTCSAGVTVNANVGTTQPVNFTGSGGSALVKSDAVDINSVAAGSATIGFVGDLTTSAKLDVENAVWNASTGSHTVGGTTGAALLAAGSAGDPWATVIPGPYGAGTAGNIVGNNINAAVGSVPGAVWAAGTRTLTSGANIVLTKNVGLVGLNDVSISDICYTALTEAYAAPGSAFTLAQGLYEICQGITEFTVAGTGITVRKRNRSTTATTYTLDQAPPNAAARTRAT